MLNLRLFFSFILLSTCFLNSFSYANNTDKNKTIKLQQSQSAQQLTVSALSSALDFISEGDKKNAIAQVKIAIKNLRQIPTLPKYQVKGMSKRLNTAIATLKSGKDSKAIDEITHVHDELAF